MAIEPNQPLHLTGAAILVSRGMKVLQAAPAAYPYRSQKRGLMVSQEIVRRVRKTATALIGFEWQPFDPTAILRFRDRAGETLLVRLEGLHFVTTRQSLAGGDLSHMPIGDEYWKDWPIDYFDIQESSEFLERFLTGNLGFITYVCLYSCNGAGQTEPAFVRPVHLTLATGGGHLDAVCETVRLEQWCNGESGVPANPPTI